MTLARRIVPRLDTDGSRLVQGVGLQNLRDSGDPAELASRYGAEGADELVLLNLPASPSGRAVFAETVRRVAAQLCIPLTAGGGIGSVEETRALLRAGADKVIVNTAAVREPELITRLSAEFGAEAVVLAIDAKRRDGIWEVIVRGAEAAGENVVSWAQEGCERGAGEILVTSMDREGTREGYDCALSDTVCDAVNVAVMVSGGAGTPDDFLAVFTDGRADAALAASMFHEGTVSIRTLKQYLDSRGVTVRT